MLITAEQMAEAIRTEQAEPWNRQLGGRTVAAVRFNDQWWIPIADGSDSYQSAPQRLADLLDDGRERLRAADETVQDVDERRRWHVSGQVP